MIKDKAIKKYLLSTVKKTEIDIVQHLANDLRPYDIAEKTGLTKRTIDTYIFELRNKFDCRSVTGIVVLFFREGLIK